MRTITVLSCIALLTTISAFGKTITVPDQTSSIQAAVDKSDEGDTILVRDGIWKETVALKDGISLIGTSVSGTVLAGKRRGPVVHGANGSLIKNCTVTRGRTGILCENVDMTIEQVIVRDNIESGIHCLVSLPNIYNCVIRRNRGSGIFCEGTRSIKTSIMHNIIAENGHCGIMLQGVSEVLIQNNVFLGNKEFGVWGSMETKRTRIVYNDFYDNRSAVNDYLARDPSNITENPGFAQSGTDADYFSAPGTALKGRGKDGATIGIINGETLNRKLSDPDEDGIAGADDQCPSIAEDKDGFEDGDGCPEFDNDKDGIYDDIDACPGAPEDYDRFRDEDGCPDFDNDNDGIADSVDVCKSNPETPNGFKDDDGCPDELLPGAAVTAPASRDSVAVPPAAANPDTSKSAAPATPATKPEGKPSR